MPDFGVAGKLTIREYDGAVKVRVSQGEYLFFRLTGPRDLWRQGSDCFELWRREQMDVEYRCNSYGAG
jgi:hypothetical protein